MIRRLIATAIAVLAAVSLLRWATAQQPVGHWPFDQGEGTNTVDASANANHGTLSGEPPPVWTSGVSSNALGFDGVQNEVIVPDAPALSPTNALSLMAWVKAATNLTSDILGKWSTNEVAGSYILGLTNGLVKLELMLDGQHVEVVGISGLPSTNWNWLAGTFDGKQMMVFLNGNAVGVRRARGEIGVANVPLRVGLLAGGVDDVRIYDQALDPASLSQIWAVSRGLEQKQLTLEASELAEGVPLAIPEVSPQKAAPNAEQQMLLSMDLTAGLRGWWKMDEGTGTTANDSSGNTNHASFYNGTAWASGVDSNCASFDGVNDYANVGDRSTLENNQSWTFATWVLPLPTLLSSEAKMLYKESVLKFSLQSRRVAVQIGNGWYFQNETLSNYYIPSNKWTHVVVTYTNSQVKIYYNGQLYETHSRSYTMGQNSKTFTIAASQNDCAIKLDDLRYYNRALGTDEVQALHAVDSDGDGLPSILELEIHRTDPQRADTDGDGMPDGWEVAQYQTGGLLGTYYNDRQLSNCVVRRTDSTINFDWGSAAPDPQMSSDNFSVRWYGQVRPKNSETITFHTVSDDGVRLWVDNKSVVNNWTDHTSTTNSGSILLVSNQTYQIQMEHYDKLGFAEARLLWSSPSQTNEVIPATHLLFSPLNPVVADDSSDPDTDGFNNLQEFAFGTQPANSASHPDTNALPPYLLGWWPLDEGTGTNLTDTSANGRHGCLVGNPTWISGILSNALEFTTNQWANLPSSAGLNQATNSLTISTWIKPTAAAGTAFLPILRKGDGFANGWALGLSNGLHIAFLMTSNNALCTATAVTSGVWTHVGVTVAQTNLTIYLNGIAATNLACASSPLANTNALVLGQFNGCIDDLRVYSQPLSAAQLLALAAVGDSDGDGMPNSWEIQHGLDPERNDASEDLDQDGLSNLQEYQQGSDPQDFYNGLPVQLQVVSGNNQAGFTNAFCPQPLLVSVSATNGVAHTNAPLQFVVLGTGAIAPDNSGNGLTNALSLRSDTNGQAAVWFRLPSTWATTNQVQAMAVSGNSTSLVTFSAQTSTLPDLVGWWRLDEGTGTNILDSSGFQNNGITVANPTWIAGAYSNALQFSGTATDDHVRVPISDSLNASNAITVAAWVWPTSMPWQEMAVVSYRAREYDNGWRMFYYPNRISFQWAPTGQTYRWLYANGSFPSNTWAHIAATFQAGRAELFVNGQRVAVDNNAGTNLVLTAASYPLRIGRCDNGNAYRFPGKIDDVRLYSRALSTNEVAALFSHIGDGIADWWKLQNGLSTTDPTVAAADPDNDGLTNLQEYQLGTNPNHADTDGDGLPDGLDAAPTVADSTPPTFLVISPADGEVLNP